MEKRENIDELRDEISIDSGNRKEREER